MTVTAVHPVARGWEISGPGIARLGAPERFCAVVLSDLEDQVGYLGKIVLANREMRWLRGISFWETEATSEPSWEAFAGTARDVFGPDCEVGGPQPFEVLFSDFTTTHLRLQQGGGSERLVVRVTAFEGRHVMDPAVVEVLLACLAEYVSEAPGCEGALVLHEPDRAALMVVSSWVDDDAAMASRIASESLKAIDASTETTSTSVGTYEVLVHHPMTRTLH